MAAQPLQARRGVRVTCVALLLAAVTAGAFPPSAAAAGARAGVGGTVAPLLNATLFGVAATSARNVWAVGQYQSGTVNRTLIVHWNGRKWKVVPSPVKVGNLEGVAATSATNAWAVGFSGSALKNSSELAEHWNGKAWRVVHSPDPAGAGALYSVATTSAGSAWAVSGAAGQGLGTFTSVINHWSGRAWTRVKSPDPVPGGAIFLGAAAASASSAWAVGSDWVFVNGPHNVIAHWNGKSWKLVPSPILDGSLYGATAISAASAWAVGSGDAGAIIEHWNGTRWTGTTFG